MSTLRKLSNLFKKKAQEVTDSDIVVEPASLPQISPVTYSGQMLMNLGYTGIEYNNSIVVFNTSNLDILSVSINPFAKKDNKHSV